MRDRNALKAGLLLLRAMASRYASGPLPEWDTFALSASIVRTKRRSRVEHQPNDVLIVLSGCVKAVYEEPSGLQGQIGEFFTTGSAIAPRVKPQWLGRMRSPFAVSRWFGARETSLPQLSAYAVEDSVLLRFDTRIVQQLATKYAPWGEVYSAFLWTYIETLHNTIIGLRMKDVRMRYLDLLQRKELRGRLTQRDIAAYLGVTEAALSRIIRSLGTQGGGKSSRGSTTPDADADDIDTDDDLFG